VGGPTVTEALIFATGQLAAQARAGARPAPDAVIWPENSTDLDPGRNPPIYATIAAAVAAIGRPVLVGAVLQDPLRNTGRDPPPSLAPDRCRYRSRGH